jgi:hypothetical protein
MADARSSRPQVVSSSHGALKVLHLTEGIGGIVSKQPLRGHIGVVTGLLRSNDLECCTAESPAS